MSKADDTIRKLCEQSGCTLERGAPIDLLEPRQYEVVFPEGKMFDGCHSYLAGTTKQDAIRELKFFVRVAERDAWEEDPEYDPDQDLGQGEGDDPEL
jgi:hypothetical protein